MPINESSTLTDPQRAWVDALRSGKYAQTTNVLCLLNDEGEPVGYCCLGVACEVAIEHGVKVTTAHVAFVRQFDGQRMVLPRSVREWLGVSTEMGNWSGYEDGVGNSLGRRNDVGATFEELAALIESQPDGLFARDES